MSDNNNKGFTNMDEEERKEIARKNGQGSQGTGQASSGDKSE